MKTVIVQGDGIASHVLPELSGQTPLQVAKTPNLDALAAQGEFGSLSISSEGFPLSSAVTQVALLGNDPQKYCSGLGPFEASSLDVILEAQDVAFLCNLVTLGSPTGQAENKKLGSHLILEDAEAGGIDSEEARELIDLLNEQLGSETIQFYTGEQHRHVMVWIGGSIHCHCHSPRVAQGQSLESFLPSGQGADVVKEVMEASRHLLRYHPVNQEREQAGLKPANCLWLWGPGRARALPKWQERWPIPSVIISSSGIHRGIGKSAGIHTLNPQEYRDGHTQGFKPYTQSCLTALESNDFVYVHVPMPYVEKKMDVQSIVKTIEQFDEEVIGSLLPSVADGSELRLFVVCNQDDLGAHDPTMFITPFAYSEKSRVRTQTTRMSFDEVHVAQGLKCDATRVATRLLSPKAC